MYNRRHRITDALRSRRRAKRPKLTPNPVDDADAASLQAQIAELTGRMLRKKLFLVRHTAKVTPDKLGPLLPAHLKFMTELARRGVLFAAGPIMDEKGAPTGDGMALFNTSTLAQARELAEQDPFYIQGLRTIDVKEWVLMEGAMTITLNFAERTLDVA